MEKDFEEYDIIKYLKEKNAIYYSNIEKLYYICESILAEIPKQFSGYTLHDIKHSVRVIGYMNELVRHHIEDFSELQLAIIVYVGLLHDIGMFVSDDEKNTLILKFESNSKYKEMTSNQKEIYLREHIRKNHGKRVVKVLNSNINENSTIKSLLSVGESLSYNLEDLIYKICQSHTESCEWIRENLPIECDYANDTINPQYTAFLLRVGDALDIDDRRAPYVLYKLLNPQGISNIEWKKHIPVRNYNKIKKINNSYQITFCGECAEPEIYRKIMEYIDWINDDIQKINSISDGFSACYRLNIIYPLKNEIKSYGFSSELLRFELDYNRVIKLLMGEKIYGNRRDGLRELIQNSIDAVKLMSDIYDNKAEYGTMSYVPEIRIIINKRKNTFEILDNGTGMSQEILEKYFFNVGNSYYTSEEFNELNNKYEPIGHFGIGFLACFMLSSKIRLETQYYNSRDRIEMIFDKESPYVTRLENQVKFANMSHGTKIILEYDKVIPDIFSDDSDIIKYIDNLLIIEGYDFYFVNQDMKESKKIAGSQLPLDYRKDGEEIGLKYKLKEIPSIMFNIYNCFENNERVYLVDTSDINETEIYTNLEFYQENIRNLQIEIQTEQIKINDLVNYIDAPSGYVISQFALNALDKIWEEVENEVIDDNICDLLRNYVYKYIKNEELVWYDIPIVLNENIFWSFVKCADNEGIEEAIRQYSANLKYISILSNEKLTNSLILDIVEEYIDVYTIISDDLLDVSYLTRYPIAPIKRRKKLYGISKIKAYIELEEKDMDANYYLKGVRINDKTRIPYYAIKGIDITNIYINIRKGMYSTDVSRNNFDSESRNRIINRIVCMIYGDIVKRDILALEEVQLVEKFLEDYYDEEME